MEDPRDDHVGGRHAILEDAGVPAEADDQLPRSPVWTSGPASLGEAIAGPDGVRDDNTRTWSRAGGFLGEEGPQSQEVPVG